MRTRSNGRIQKTVFTLALVGVAAAAPMGHLLAQDAVLAPGTALRLVLDHSARMRKGASLTGHLTEPVYLVDHEVVPVGALVTGTIRGTHPGPKSVRVRRLLAADFTPPREPDAVFTSLTIPAKGDVAAHTVVIEAPAVETSASVLTMGTKKGKQSIKAQVGGFLKQRRQDVRDTLRKHHYAEIVEKWAVGQLPYHPDILWTETCFNADLAAPATIPDPVHASLPLEDLRGRLPQGVLHARLVRSLSSETAKRGDPVDAVITEPLLSEDRTQLLVPQGTHLGGVVVQTRAARRFGRNGDLRFAFRKLDLPNGEGTPQPADIHGRLSAAETAPGEHATIDEEGEIKAGNGPGKYVEPALLLALAVGAGHHDDDGHSGDAGLGGSAVGSNGFGLIARIVSLSTRNVQVVQGFAYYALAKSVYYNFVAKGHETTFPRDTEIQVTLSER